MKKRLTAMLLVVCMLFTFMPMTAFAVDPQLICGLSVHTHDAKPTGISKEIANRLRDSDIERQEGKHQPPHGYATFRSENACWETTIKVYSTSLGKNLFEKARSDGKVDEYIAAKFPAGVDWKLTCTTQEHQHTDACYSAPEPTDPMAQLKKKVLELVGDDTYKFNVYYRYDGKLPADEDAVTTKGEPGTFGPSGNDTPLVTVAVDLKGLFADGDFDELAKISIKESSNWFYIYSAKYNGSTAPSKIAEIDDFWALIEKHMTSGKSELESKSDGKFVGYVLKCENEGGHLDGVLEVLPPVYSAEMYDPDGKLLKVEFESGDGVKGETTPTNGGVKWSAVEAVFENYLKEEYDAEEVSFSEGTFVADGYRYSFAITSSTESEKNGEYIKGYEKITQTVDKKSSVVGYLAKFKISKPTPVTGKLTISKKVEGVSADKLPKSFKITATQVVAEGKTPDVYPDVYEFTKTDITSGKTFTNVKPGTYTLAETGADVDHYTLSSDLLAEVMVTAGQEETVRAVNTYTRSDYDYKFVNGETEVASGTKDMDVAIGAAPADPEVNDGQRFDGWFEQTTRERFDPEQAYNEDVVFEAKFTDVVKVTKELTTIQDTYHVGDEVSFKITVKILEDTTEPLTITEVPGTGLINGKLTCNNDKTLLGKYKLDKIRSAEVKIDGDTATVTPVKVLGTGGLFKKGDTITFNYTVNLGMPGSDANIFGGNQTCNKVDATLDGATSTATTDPINKVNQPKIDVDVEKKVTKINGDSYKDGMTAKKGDVITYEITVKNTGSVPVFGVPVVELPSAGLKDGHFIPEETTEIDLGNLTLEGLIKLLKDGKTTLNLAIGSKINVVVTADWKKIEDPKTLYEIAKELLSIRDLNDVLDVLDQIVTKPDFDVDSVQGALKSVEEYISTLLDKYRFLNMTIYFDGVKADVALIGRIDKNDTAELKYEATVDSCDENGNIKNTVKVPFGPGAEETIDAELVTVTYTDGVYDEEVFVDQKYTVLKGAATPAFKGTFTREGYDFTGWKNDVDSDTIYTDAEIAELTVDNDIIYTAQWAEKKYPVLFYIQGLQTKEYQVQNPVEEIPVLKVESGYVYLNAKYTTVKDTEGATGNTNVGTWLDTNIPGYSMDYNLPSLISAANKKNATPLKVADYKGWEYTQVEWIADDNAWHVHLKLIPKAKVHLTVKYVDDNGNPLKSPYSTTLLEGDAYNVANLIYDGIDKGEDHYVKISVDGDVVQDTAKDKDIEIIVTYSLDNWNDAEDKTTGGDTIPDKYQAKIVYLPDNPNRGSVTRTLDIVTLKDGKDGNDAYAESATVTAKSNATAKDDYKFVNWTASPNVPGFASSEKLNLEHSFTAVGKGEYTFTANFALYTSQYIIEYYYDDVQDVSKTELIKAEIGKRIESYVDKPVEGFAFDKVVGLPLTVQEAATKNTIKVYYAKDVIGGGTDAEKPDKIPDKYEIIVKYTTDGHGSIEKPKSKYQTFDVRKLKQNNDGTYTIHLTAEADANRRYKFKSWTSDFNLGNQDYTLDAYVDAKVGTYIVKANFKKKSSGGSGGKVEIKEPEVPQGLNGDDHFQYIFGYDDGTVRPLAKITRAEIAAIFYRLLDDETREYYFTTENDFPDMKDTMWYNKAVSTLANAGIITGCSDGLFHGGRNITRAELATIIAKFDMITYEGEDIFSDISGHWAREYINSSADKGWIVGDGTGKFRPYDDITRAEVMTMINAVLNRAVDEDGLCKGYKKWPDNTKGTWYYYQVIEATNYHDYEREADLSEIWTEILPDKTWDEAGR